MPKMEVGVPLLVAALIVGGLAAIFGVIFGSGSTAYQLRNAGNEALAQGNLYTAREKLERANLIYENNPDYLADLAAVYTALERHPDAVTAYTKALEINPDHPQALVGRAEALTAMGQAEEAQRDLNKAKWLGWPVKAQPSR